MRSIHALGLSSFVLLAACADVTGGSEPVRHVVQGDSADDCAPDDKSCAQPTPPGSCSDVVLGDGVTCQSYTDLKTEATSACAAVGGGLTDLQIDPEAEEGCDGGAVEATYTCCLAPEAPDGPVCTGDMLGDGSTCISAASLHDEASALCAAAGAELTELWSGGECEGGSTIAKYLCCSP